MKNLFLICTFICLVSALETKAQLSNNKDSLLQQLNIAKEDSNKAKLLLNIAQLYADSAPQTAAAYFSQAKNLCLKIDYKKGLIRYYGSCSNIYNKQGLFDSTIALDKEAIALFRKMKYDLGLAISLYNIAIPYQMLGQNENAVQSVQQSKDIFARIGNKDYEGQQYTLLQLLSVNMRQYRKGINYGQQAISILEKNDKENNLSYAYGNLGLNFIHLQQYDSARYFLKKSFAKAKQEGNYIIQTIYYLNMGYIDLRQQRFDAMKPNVEKSLVLAHQNEMHEQEMQGLWGLFNYYLSKKDYTNAKIYADSSLKITNQYNLRKDKLLLYPTLSNYYFAVQDIKQGFYYNFQNELLGDSILNEEIQRNTVDIEKKYESERKDNQIKTQQTALQQKNVLNYLLIAVAFALLLISLLGYRNYKHRQRLQQIKIDELETEKQLTATEAVLKGEEQERSRLAKDLHDGLGGMLSGIKYSLSAVKGNLVMLPDDQLAFDRSLDMLDSSIKEMRRVAHNMMPETLINFGLDTALKDFCNAINEMSTLRIRYQSFGLQDNNIEQTTAIAIYRIIQELTGNILKHSGAQEALVQLSREDKKLSVTVEDNGRGFDIGAIKNVKGIGLSGIRNRIAFLKGSFDIQSEPGKGTSVYIEINPGL